jgi:hypothetical protein
MKKNDKLGKRRNRGGDGSSPVESGDSSAGTGRPHLEKRHASQQSLNGAVKSICDIMRRSNCAGALEEGRPHREKAAELSAEAKLLKDKIRERRKAKKLADIELEEKWKAVEREARESLAKGDSIENAVYDLKAVNPNRVTKEDKRTPDQLLEFIAAKGLEADASLKALRGLIVSQS